jgi:hypothetical protein
VLCAGALICAWLQPVAFVIGLAPHLPLGFLQHGITFFLQNKSGAKIANQQLQPLSGDIPRWGEKTQYFVTLL